MLLKEFRNSKYRCNPHVSWLDANDRRTHKLGEDGHALLLCVCARCHYAQSRAVPNATSVPGGRRRVFTPRKDGLQLAQRVCSGRDTDGVVFSYGLAPDIYGEDLIVEDSFLKGLWESNEGTYAYQARVTIP